MSKITLSNVQDLTQPTAAAITINTNNAVVQTEFDNTLSRDGTSPNQMEATLDMNGWPIVNLPAPLGNTSPLRLQDLQTFNGGGTIQAIPAGGTTGQILKKNSNTNYDVGWGANSGVTAGTNINITGGVVSTINSPNFSTSVTTPSLVLNGSTLNGVTGTGNVVLATSPTLVTPTLGVATATSINGNTITGSGTLNLTSSKTLTVNNTVTLAGTDGTTQTFPSTSGTVVSSVTSAGGDLTGTYPSPTIANSAVTNAKSANMLAYSIKGNAAGSAATPTDIQIQNLTQKASPVSGDLVMIVDSAASNALKYATVGSVGSAGSVSSVGGATGVITLTAADLAISSNAISLSTARKTLPTTQTFTSGSGTYTTPSNVLYIEVNMQGAGGGGGNSGTTTGTAGSNGGATTFSTLTANGGTVANTFNPGSGGSASGGYFNYAGAAGQGGIALNSVPGGNGGLSYSGGVGWGGTQGGSSGFAAATNSGSGGGGGGSYTTSTQSGGGGGAGAYVKAIINNPSATYSYAVGAGGSGQGAGTNGYAGGNGGSGHITVVEHYN